MSERGEEASFVDISTIAGIVICSACVMLAILLVGGSVGAYIDVPSMLIVIGGGMAATLTSYPLPVFMNLPKVVLKTIFNSPPDIPKIITQLVELAEVARRDGILALEGMVDQMDDDFLINGIQMAVDGADPESIQVGMETELENVMERHDGCKGLLDAIAKYAPAFGMIGTLIGLVAMLSNMDDPAKIGAGMAAALLTTLYGALVANIVASPLADKLAKRSSEEVLAKTIIIQGVMGIQSGDNPRNVQSKLMTFLPPAQRTPLDDVG